MQFRVFHYNAIAIANFYQIENNKIIYLDCEICHSTSLLLSLPLLLLLFLFLLLTSSYDGNFCSALTFCLSVQLLLLLLQAQCSVSGRMKEKEL